MDKIFCNGKLKKLEGKKIKPESTSARMHPHVFATKSVISSFSQCMQRLLVINWQPWKISPQRLCIWQGVCNYLGVRRSCKVLQEKAACNIQLVLRIYNPQELQYLFLNSICCSLIYSLEVSIRRHRDQTCNYRDFPLTQDYEKISNLKKSSSLLSSTMLQDGRRYVRQIQSAILRLMLRKHLHSVGRYSSIWKKE